jgi:hypothetical protein
MARRSARAATGGIYPTAKNPVLGGSLIPFRTKLRRSISLTRGLGLEAVVKAACDNLNQML